MTTAADKRAEHRRARTSPPSPPPPSSSPPRSTKQTRLKDIEQAFRLGNLGKVPVREALEGYLKFMEDISAKPSYIHDSKSTLETFVRHQKLEDKHLSDIDESTVNGYINREGKAGAWYRRREMSILSRFFQICNAKGWIMGNPAKLTRVRMDRLTHEQKEVRERRPFEQEEIAKLIEYLENEQADLTENRDKILLSTKGTLTDRQKARLLALENRISDALFWRAAVIISRFAGLRLGDIARLEWACFSKPGDFIVWTGKSDKRVQPAGLTPGGLEAILLIAKEVPRNATHPERVFPRHYEIGTDVVNRASLSTYFARVLKRAGIKDHTFHDLRSTFILDCKERGVSMEDIAAGVAHSDTSTTMRYIPKAKR